MVCFTFFSFSDIGPKYDNSKKRVTRPKTSSVWEPPTYGDFSHKGKCVQLQFN